MKVLSRALWAATGLALGIGVGASLQADSRPGYKEMYDILGQVLSYVDNKYVEETSSGELIEDAIEGMVHSLDPYSDFLTPDETEELRTSTEGTYGGIGMQVGTRDGLPTVISPFEGTPAYRKGLSPGDRIVEIEGETTSGLSLDEVVSKLRGDPGTDVTIKISRSGLAEYLEITLTREKIVIHAVRYSGMLDNSTGYIKLASFSDKASGETRRALEELFEQGAKKIVLDLRGNPGGLLSEAWKVTDLFLPRDALVVSTKGRNGSNGQSFYSKYNPVNGSDYPLVVLVDRGSASASEIVAGALQDWDRAVVIGDTSFGKGSVQSIFTVAPERLNYKLRLTTAKYYTPSGRCIHRDPAGADEDLVYFTKRFDRHVYGAGGIAPDIFAENEKITGLTSKALAKGAFFDYAVGYSKKSPKPTDQYSAIKLSSETLKDFNEFLEDEKGIEFIQCEADEAYSQEIKFLAAEIAEKYWGEAGRYRQTFADDEVIATALNILRPARVADDMFKELASRAD